MRDHRGTVRSAIQLRPDDYLSRVESVLGDRVHLTMPAPRWSVTSTLFSSVIPRSTLEPGFWCAPPTLRAVSHLPRPHSDNEVSTEGSLVFLLLALAHEYWVGAVRDVALPARSPRRRR